jgi:hypothetical protein
LADKSAFVEQADQLVNQATSLEDLKLGQEKVDQAQQMITNLPKSIDQDNRDRTTREILTIINQLEKVKPQTTVHANAVEMMNFANQKLQQLR